MKSFVIGIIIITLVLSLNVQNGFGHTPDFEVKTTEDILKFCEFFYEEYKLLGINSLVDQHPSFPNLRACAILYNHVAWESTHEARDIVLISEIEKYLGDSSYIKERYLEHNNTIPNWIKKEAQLWVNNENQDMGFAYAIRTLLEAGVLTLDTSQKVCVENNLCFQEGDFIKYSHFDKYGKISTLEHKVETIAEDEIFIQTKEISQNGVTKEQIILDKTGIIKSENCCQHYEYLILTPMKIGDSLYDDLEIVSATTYVFDGQIKDVWFASNPTKQNTKIIDKNTGLVFLHKFHETKVLTVGDETKITETNFFEAKYNMASYQTVIPEWWKTTTTWLLDEKISETEYLRAMENLISRNILRV